MSTLVSAKSIECGRHVLSLERTLIMGVVNVTPDSFSDGGLFLYADRAIEHAQRLVDEGADLIDVGGESSRPGSDPVSREDELKRVGPVVESLAAKLSVPISIDTYKPSTADRCLGLGATMLNDITGLRDDAMREVAARHDVPAVIMHMQGEPKTMQAEPSYGDVVSEVKDFLAQRAREAETAGVRQVIIDPGIGFGKTLAHNMTLFRRLTPASATRRPPATLAPRLPCLLRPAWPSFISGGASRSSTSRRSSRRWKWRSTCPSRGRVCRGD